VTEEKLRVDYRMRKKNQKLPTVLSQEQVAKIIGACENLKHRLILMSTYAAGLRASEVTALKPEHIDSGRMLIKVVHGKGGKDRYTMLSIRLLEDLRDYYRKYRPKTYLFPSSFKTRKDRPLSYESLRGIYEKARKKAGVHTGAGLHTLRIVYYSCRNRYCPKCQHMPRERWLAKRQEEILPVNYFHVVFTLPHELNAVILNHKKLMLNGLFAKNWGVSVRDPLKDPQQVLDYLARYTHRVAIANSRITSLQNAMLTFTAKNRKKNRTEPITISAVKFIRRFLLHSLPTGLVRIRH
jgi:hypothetical protein